MVKDVMNVGELVPKSKIDLIGEDFTKSLNQVGVVNVDHLAQKVDLTIVKSDALVLAVN